MRASMHTCEQAKAARQKIIHDECTPVQPLKKQRIIIKGDDAITRLLNVGRHHQGVHQDETMGKVERGDRSLNAGTCSSSAAVGVAACCAIGRSSVL